jgi:predicted RNase H-like HicB family nuclease
VFDGEPRHLSEDGRTEARHPLRQNGRHIYIEMIRRASASPSDRERVGVRRKDYHRDPMRDYEFTVVIERDEDGRYVAVCPALQGCYTEGETEDEARDLIRDAIRLHVQDRLATGEPISQEVRTTKIRLGRTATRSFKGSSPTVARRTAAGAAPPSGYRNRGIRPTKKR